jgi:phage-related protein
MADVDFSKLLAKKADDAKPPPVLPNGTYHGFIKGHNFGKSREKQTPYVQFELSVTSAGDDVDQTELVGIELSRKNLSITFYLTENSDFRLTEFLRSLGIKTEGRSFGELIPETTNAPVLISISQRLDKNDPTRIFNDVGEVKGA